MRLRWLISATASSLHAATALLRGQQFVDAELAASLTPPVTLLQQEIGAAALPEEAYLRMLSALATTFDDHRQLAKMAAYRTLGKAAPPEVAERIGARIGAIEEVLLQHNPKIIEELSLRARPLREQWEASGPGLLKQIFDATEARLMVEAADVVLVLPVLGGGGEAQLHNNSVRIEAMLTHPHPQLPETVRLAWMLAQLHLDLPIFAAEIPPPRLPRLAEWTMLVPSLNAGEELGLVQGSEALFRLATNSWYMQPPEGVDPFPVLMRWWSAYREAKPPFETALLALHDLLWPE